MSRLSLTPDELTRLARLARIGLEDAELCALRSDLAAILDYAESITREIGTPAPREAESSPDSPAACRPDEVSPWSGRVLDCAPHLRAGHVVVPRVL